MNTRLNAIYSNASEADKNLVHQKRNELKEIYKTNYKNYRNKWREASTGTKFGWHQ